VITTTPVLCGAVLVKEVPRPQPSALHPEFRGRPSLHVSQLGYLQLSRRHFVVDEFLVPALLLGDGDVGQRRLKVQDLLHLGPDGVLGPSSQQLPQLDHVVQVSRQHLRDPAPHFHQQLLPAAHGTNRARGGQSGQPWAGSQGAGGSTQETSFMNGFGSIPHHWLSMAPRIRPTQGPTWVGLCCPGPHSLWDTRHTKATRGATAQFSSWNTLLPNTPFSQVPRFELEPQVTFSACPSLSTVAHYASNLVASYLTSASSPRLEAPRGEKQAGLVGHCLPSIGHLVSTRSTQVGGLVNGQTTNLRPRLPGTSREAAGGREGKVGGLESADLDENLSLTTDGQLCDLEQVTQHL